MDKLPSYLFLWFHKMEQLTFPKYIAEAGNWPGIANTKSKLVIGPCTRKFTLK